jgi:hypothetical protein
MNVAVEQRTPGGLAPEQWLALRRLIDIIEADGRELPQVLELMETALRADQAKLIEAQ